MSPDQLPSLYAKIDRLEASIERLQAKPETERRLARIERKQKRLAMTEGKVDRILKDAELKVGFEEDSVLPRDTFVITYEPDDNRFDIEVTDSVFDRSYTGGDPLIFRYTATENTAKGTRSRTSTGTLANGDYWDGTGTQTLSIGGTLFAGVETADYVTAYVIKDNGDGLPSSVSDDDILAIEYIDVLA